MNIYSRKEIENILQGLEAAEQSAEDSRDLPPALFEKGYHVGFKAALTCFGLFFGLGTEQKLWRLEGSKWIEMDRGAGQ